jgi:hypothetical protein
MITRVARGERKSEVIEAALRKEMQKILGNGGDGHNMDGHGSEAHRGKPSTASRTVAGRIDGDSQGRREGLPVLKMLLAASIRFPTQNKKQSPTLSIQANPSSPGLPAQA